MIARPCTKEPTRKDHGYLQCLEETFAESIRYTAVFKRRARRFVRPPRAENASCLVKGSRKLCGSRDILVEVCCPIYYYYCCCVHRKNDEANFATASLNDEEHKAIFPYSGSFSILFAFSLRGGTENAAKLCFYDPVHNKCRNRPRLAHAPNTFLSAFCCGDEESDFWRSVDATVNY